MARKAERREYKAFGFFARALPILSSLQPLLFSSF